MNKFSQFLKTAAAQWAMNSDPVVVQASGYVPTKTGVEYKPSEGSDRLSDNIAVISAIPNMLMNAGMTGIIPAVTSEVGAAVGGVGGTFSGQKLDNKLDTTYWTPTLGFFGTLLGGGLGYKAGNKYGKYAIKHDMLPEGAANRRIVTDDMVKEAALEMVDEQLAKATLSKGLPHNIGWAPAQKAYWWHHSNEPITKFKVPFKERWDVINHDADPNLVWLTKEDGAAGMMSERPYHQQFKVALKKPMVQVGEVQTIPGQKNTSRNAIVKTARDMGADAVIFDGIADNKLRGQKVVAVMGDKVTPEAKWYVEPTTGSTVYQGISLPNPKAKSFVDDVAMLKYYAEHRPKVQRMNFMKEYPTGKYIGEGAETRVFDAGTDVEKLLDFDLATYRHLSPGHHVIKTADSPEELLQLIKSVQTSADFRNRHIFSMPVQPAIVRKPDGSYIGMFTQKKLTPLIPDPNNVNYPVESLDQQIKSVLNRPVMQELYPVRGYNITDGNFDPRTLGPLDGHVQNWAYDENGVLWGIDLMKQGGKCKNETRK